MHMEFSDEQLMLQESVERYLRDNYAFEQRQAAVRSGGGFSGGQWRQFAEMGWLAMPLPEQYGGFGAGAVETMLLCTAFGRYLVREPWLETVALAGALLARGGTNTVRDRWLAGIGEGGVHGALAYAEPHRQQGLAQVALRAVPNGGGWKLNGRKCAVCNGPAADVVLVLARTGSEPGSRDGLTLFALESSAPGLARRDYPTFDGRHASDLVLNDVVVGADSVVGEPGDALATIEPVLDRALLALGAEAVGAMLELTQATIEYTRARRQFGKALASFQVLRHRMADMFIQCELTRSLLQAAAMKLDAGSPDAPRFVAALKARVGKAGRFVGHSSIQLHGGIGMTDELKIGHYVKRLAVIDSLFGARDHHLERFARFTAMRHGTGADA